MKTITVPIDFSDVNAQDFSHYFADTLAVWSFRDKRRLFMIGGIEQHPDYGYVINGQYLTKQDKLNFKKLPFNNEWNKTLKPILSRAITFNIFGAAACFCPNRTRELKKGLKLRFETIKYFGEIKNKNELTAQAIFRAAFADLYSPDAEHSPSLRTTVYNGLGDHSAIACNRAFILTKDSLYYRKMRLGSYTDGVVTLDPKSKGFASYLVDVEGISKDRIKVA